MTPQTLLHRQVHPAWVQEGRVTSQVFKPTPKDKKRLSVYDGDQINPSSAFDHFTQTLRFRSIGVLAVNVQECETLALPVKSDPEPFPEHAVICFDECSNSQIEKNSKRLKHFALQRGWQFKAE